MPEQYEQIRLGLLSNLPSAEESEISDLATKPCLILPGTAASQLAKVDVTSAVSEPTTNTCT